MLKLGHWVKKNQKPESVEYFTFFLLLEQIELEFELQDFLKHQKEMLIAMSGIYKKVLWVEVILPTAG